MRLRAHPCAPPLYSHRSKVGEPDPESGVAADVHQQKQCPARTARTGPDNERRVRLEGKLRPLATAC